MTITTNKTHALIALNSFADSCRAKLAGKPEQIAQVDALVFKAQSLPDSFFDAAGYSLHSGFGSEIEAGRNVAQAVAKF